jgi:hypothetical protein
MLSRVALDQEKEFADVVLDFLLDVDTSSPDFIDVTAKASSIRVRLRVGQVTVPAPSCPTGVTV